MGLLHLIIPKEKYSEQVWVYMSPVNPCTQTEGENNLYLKKNKLNITNQSFSYSSSGRKKITRAK